VDITIASAVTGAIVRRLAVPFRDVGQYSVVWDGTSVSSAPTKANPGGRSAPTPVVVSAGAYRITTVVTDALGAHATFTDTVNVSSKKLVWYTGSTILNGNRYAARGGTAGSIGASPVYSGGMRMTLPFSMSPEYNALGYQFTLPAATRYSAISFSVLGSGNESVDIGLQDSQLGTWPTGSAWIVDDFSPIIGVSSAYRWTSLAGNPTDNRIGRTVRGLVLDLYGGHYDVAKVKLTYRYALLK
jgi:hypothetical protein